jgi:hypothetical protein
VLLEVIVRLAVVVGVAALVGRVFKRRHRASSTEGEHGALSPRAPSQRGSERNVMSRLSTQDPEETVGKGA